MTYNTIKLFVRSDIMEEIKAGTTILPGMLLLLDDDGTVKPHDDDAPAHATPLFAIEDVWQGKGIETTYSSGDKVRVWTPGRGDVALAILKDGADVKIGDFLESDGNGYLQKATSGVAVAQALEAIDLSGTDLIADIDTVLGYKKRIKVKII